jgi:serine/threonine protein phosphatase PrpC
MLAAPPTAVQAVMSLAIRVGSATTTGKRDRNEDYCGLVTPDGPTLAARGAMVAVADGVSGGEAGREAAEYCVRSLLADYYSTPDTWEVALSLDRVLGAINRWLVGQGIAHEPHRTTTTTLSVLVLRGSRYYIGHVGDSRVYRLRDHALTRLTDDHVWDHPERQHVLKRAVGLDRHLVVDHADGELLVGDTFLVCSDGVWNPLAELHMAEILELRRDPVHAAEALVNAAVDAGGQDNATAAVVHVDGVSSASWREMVQANSDLPVPGKLTIGQYIDDFEVVDLVHESRATRLYRVRARGSGQMLALKTLQPLLGDDPQSRDGLLAEEWLAKRVVSAQFPQVVPIPGSSRHYLYYVMTWHVGATLQQHLDRGQHFSTGDVVHIGIQVAQGLGTLHRLSILHRDIKPANLLQGEDGRIRILDLGVALAAGVPYPELETNPGTPSFMAPELHAGEPASTQSDVYAAGVCLYHLLTRKYPYGEIEPFQHPAFGNPIPPTRYRPDIPRWMENLLLRAVARNKPERFETAEELLLALERGEARDLSPPLPVALWQRSAATRWQLVAIASVVVNVLLLYLLLVR